MAATSADAIAAINLKPYQGLKLTRIGTGITGEDGKPQLT